MQIKFLYFILFFYCFIFNIETSAEDLKSLKFADELFKSHEYLQASVEYKRFLWYNPNYKDRDIILLNIGRSYYNEKLYYKAIEWNHNILSEASSDSIRNYIKFYTGNSYFELSYYDNALNTYDSIIKNVKNQLLLNKVYYMNAFSYLQRGELEYSKRNFQLISSKSDELYLDANKYIKYLDEFNLKDFKNPKIAGILGIVPGLGYAYNGYFQTGLAALLVNSIFMGATYKAFKDDKDATSVFCSILSLGLYIGSIYGSVQTSYRFNNNLLKDFYSKFKRIHFN